MHGNVRARSRWMIRSCGDRSRHNWPYTVSRCKEADLDMACQIKPLTLSGIPAWSLIDSRCGILQATRSKSCITASQKSQSISSLLCSNDDDDAVTAVLSVTSCWTVEKCARNLLECMHIDFGSFSSIAFCRSICAKMKTVDSLCFSVSNRYLAKMIYDSLLLPLFTCGAMRAFSSCNRVNKLSEDENCDINQ